MRSRIGMFDSFVIFKVYRCIYCERRVWPWQAKTDDLDHQTCHDDAVTDQLASALPSMIEEFRAIRDQGQAFRRTTAR